MTGTANTFEANVGLRVLDEHGRPLAEYFATATAGTGTRGTFRASAAFRAPRGARTITLMGFEASAETGKPIKVVRVTLPLR